MKIPCRIIPFVAGVMAVAGLSTTTSAAVTLPISAALPTNSVSNPGFVVRTVQASTNDVTGNSFIRALRQINGTLTDAGGNVLTNAAIPGTNALGAYFTDFVSFERFANFVEPKDADGNLTGTFFTTDYFQGIPGFDGNDTQFADESVALVVLNAGTYTLAISANAERTDINDDDGCYVFVGANPRDFFATEIARFQRTAGTAGFQNDQRVENQIEVVVPVTGAYPFRLLHWQQASGASLQFYVVDTNLNVRYLINDATDPTTPLAYRSSTSAAYNSPYVGEISPPPGSAGNSGATPVVIVLFDGTPVTVNTNSIQLSLNNVPVVPQSIIKSGNKTTIQYNPQPGRTEINNSMRLVYSDSGSASHTNTWSFAIVPAGGSSTTIAGQWDFDFGDLRATAGAPLKYIDPAYDGPTGTNANKTQFGTTVSFGIPDVNGQVANVIQRCLVTPGRAAAVWVTL